MKCDQDLCLNLCYDLKKFNFGKMNSTLGSVVPLAMFHNMSYVQSEKYKWNTAWQLARGTEAPLTLVPFLHIHFWKSYYLHSSTPPRRLSINCKIQSFCWTPLLWPMCMYTAITWPHPTITPLRFFFFVVKTSLRPLSLSFFPWILDWQTGVIWWWFY